MTAFAQFVHHHWGMCIFLAWLSSWPLSGPSQAITVALVDNKKKS